ncbi:hypothetical protein V8E53_015798 [Lactarius tabidus]
MASFSTTFPAPTPPSTPLAPILAQDPDTKTGVEPAYDSSATAIVDATFLDIFEASFTPLILTPTQDLDIFKPSSPLLTPTLAQDPASDTKMRVEQEPLAHLSFANTMADATANVLDLDGTFGHRVPVSPSITDSTALDRFKAFGHGTDIISDRFTPINVHKHPSQAIQDCAEVVCKKMSLSPLSVQKVYEFIGLSFEEQHLALYSELLRLGDAISP